MLSEYYGKDMNDSQINTYLITLDDLPPELLDMAAKQLIKTGHPFMPRVVELRKAAGEIKREGKYSPKYEDPLMLIPGAAQTEADLDERYGKTEEWNEIDKILISEKYDELTDRQQSLLRGDSIV